MEPAELLNSKGKARDQQRRVFNLFCQHPEFDFTPAEVHARLSDMLLTSVRRSITNLTEAGKLEKTDTLRQGKFGKPNFTWRIKR